MRRKEERACAHVRGRGRNEGAGRGREEGGRERERECVCVKRVRGFETHREQGRALKRKLKMSQRAQPCFGCEMDVVSDTDKLPISFN